MSDPTTSDEFLIERISHDDESALMELMERYYQHLCRFSLSLLDRSDLVEEVVSSVFLSIWQRRHKLSIDTNLRSYLFSAVSKQSVKMLNRHVRGVATVSTSMPSGEVILAPERSDEGILYKEFVEQIESVLSQMPSQRRRIFKMNRLENLRYREIAEKLSISEHTVRNHMIKAIEQIEAIRPEFAKILTGESSLLPNPNQLSPNPGQEKPQR